jgi:cytosine/adenosine deaminase-related metal-dependent hydrolase
MAMARQEGAYHVKGLLIPGGLVHPHIHLDKCYLLDKTPVQDGSFNEAVARTGEAKSHFFEDDLVQRGERLIRDSVEKGVLVMRAHVEVDPTVGHQCLSAGQILKQRYEKYCDIQLAAFAQDPLLYPDDPHKQEKMLELLVGACQSSDVTALGSAPYVENAFKNESDNYRAQCQNVRIIFELASKFDKDIDFHLDYNLDPKCEPLLWFVLEEAHRHRWKRMLTIGHATRLSLFKQEEWARLQRLKEGLNVAFVGLPPSDIYMQGRETPYAQRTRATLPLLQLAIRGFPTALGVK